MYFIGSYEGRKVKVCRVFIYWDMWVSVRLGWYTNASLYISQTELITFNFIIIFICPWRLLCVSIQLCFSLRVLFYTGSSDSLSSVPMVGFIFVFLLM